MSDNQENFYVQNRTCCKCGLVVGFIESVTNPFADGRDGDKVGLYCRHCLLRQNERTIAALDVIGVILAQILEAINDWKKTSS